MARKPPAPTTSRPLSSSAQVSAVARLEARIKELSDLSVANLTSGDDPSVSGLESRISSTLASIYGENSSEYGRLQIAASLDATTYAVRWDGGQPDPREIREGVDRGRHRAISVLQGEVDAVKEAIQFSAPSLSAPVRSAPPSREVFIVHGRDDAAKIEVARLVERAGLEAIILHEQANGGRTIIQKFEDHGGAAGFAIIVMTPDDVGGLDKDSLQPRARQNVIGEMFWFAGRLGRERVCALKKGALEVPTDFAGVGYVDMDSSGVWKKDVLRELEHAGYKDLDWQKALG
jgi:predicted nucleotide-binding protein